MILTGDDNKRVAMGKNRSQSILFYISRVKGEWMERIAFLDVHRK